MLTARSALNWVCALLVGLLIGLVGGVFAEQTLPDLIPVIAPGSAPGHLDARTLNEALQILRTNYYNRNLDYSKLSQGTVRGLIQGLNDPFSEYLDPHEYQNQQNSYAGRYTGIGIYVDFRTDYPTVSGVISSSPAARAGLQPNDVIISVDGRDAHGLKPDAAAAEIQGPEGTVVKLVVDRGGQRLRYSIKRSHIDLPFVRSRVLGSALYIRIYSFGTNTTSEFDSTLSQNLRHARSVVLDLRGNPGGYVSSATDIIDAFVTSGEAFELRDRTGNVQRTDVAGRHLAPTIPLVVLVDSNSASASEILAGSLQVHHRARLVGTKTFGKGSVQEDFPLFDGSDLHITIRHWFLPNGASVDRVGLKPDIPVDQPGGGSMFQVDVAGSAPSSDAQLTRALQVVGQ